MLRELDYGAVRVDPITRNVMHTVGSMFVNNTDLHCWEDSLKVGKELFGKIQEETNALRNLLITTGGCLKPEKCFWYLIDYNCVEGVWEPTTTSGCKLHIHSDTRFARPYTQPQPTRIKKTLGVMDCPAREIKSHLKHTYERHGEYPS